MTRATSGPNSKGTFHKWCLVTGLRFPMYRSIVIFWNKMSFLFLTWGIASNGALRIKWRIGCA